MRRILIIHLIGHLFAGWREGTPSMRRNGRKQWMIAIAGLALLALPVGQAVCLSHHHCGGASPIDNHGEHPGSDHADSCPDAGRHEGEAFGNTGGRGHAVIGNTLKPRRAAAAATVDVPPFGESPLSGEDGAGARLPVRNGASPPSRRYGYLFAGRSPTTS